MLLWAASSIWIVYRCSRGAKASHPHLPGLFLHAVRGLVGALTRKGPPNLVLVSISVYIIGCYLELTISNLFSSTLCRAQLASRLRKGRENCIYSPRSSYAIDKTRTVRRCIAVAKDGVAAEHGEEGKRQSSIRIMVFFSMTMTNGRGHEDHEELHFSCPVGIMVR